MPGLASIFLNFTEGEDAGVGSAEVFVLANGTIDGVDVAHLLCSLSS